MIEVINDLSHDLFSNAFFWLLRLGNTQKTRTSLPHRVSVESLSCLDCSGVLLIQPLSFVCSLVSFFFLAFFLSFVVSYFYVTIAALPAWSCGQSNRYSYKYVVRQWNSHAHFFIIYFLKFSFKKWHNLTLLRRLWISLTWYPIRLLILHEICFSKDSYK